MATKLALSEFKGNDRFAIESVLGEGGMGVVYRARDLRRGRVIALKTMTRLDANALLRFKQEFRALADIAHPSVVQLFDLFAEGDQWFFTMELIDGTDFVSYVRGIERACGPASRSGLTATDSGSILRKQVASEATLDAWALPPEPPPQGPLAIPTRGQIASDESKLRAALIELLDGVRAIHAAGRLHRDIKPSNVMVTREGRVVLLDFGVVGEVGRGAERIEDFVLGTPAYMAPEQARASHVGPAADFYALGVMMYEALTGQLPFDGPPQDVLHAKQQGRPRPPSEIVDGVPADLGELCLDLLAPTPHERPEGAEILARLRSARAFAPPSAYSLTPSSSTGSGRAFVGRAEELSVLRQGVRRAARGEAVLTLVSGPSGIGKTTLVQRFLKEIGQTPRTLVLSGRCYEREAVPFKGLDSVVDELSRWLLLMPEHELAALMPAHTAELLRVFPVLRGVPALERRGEGQNVMGEPQELRRRAFAALRALLGAIADDRPLVVHIDDLQWTDVDSVALLEQVLHAPGAPAMLLIGGFRSDAVGKSAALAELLSVADRVARSARVERLELGRLAYEDCAHLAQLSLGEGAEAAPDVVRRIAEESQGLPLFVSELSAWQRSAGADESSSSVSLETVIRSRVRLLPEEGRGLLEVLCVAGGPLPHGLVDTLADVADGEALRARLRVAKLTRSVDGGERELVDLYHARIRESLLGSIDPERKRALHARLAAGLEAEPHHDAGVLVEHFLAAGDPERAKSYVLIAAESAERGLAFLRAARLYRSAIQLEVSRPRWLLERSVGDMLLSAGHAAEAAAAFASAVHHAPAGEKTALRRLAAEHFLKSGVETEGLRLLREALADVKLGYPETTASAVVSLLGNRARLKLRGLRFSLSAMAPPRELERIDVAFAASSGLAMFDVVRAADFGARHLLLALEGGEPIRICRALAFEASGRAAVDVRGRGGIEGLVRTAESLATRSNDPHAIALARLAAGLVRVFSGEWRAAQAILAAAEQIIRERCRGVHWELANAAAWSLNALILCGELKQAAERVPEQLHELRERGDRFGLMHMIYPAAITAIVADDPDTADRIAREFPKAGGEFSDRFTGGHWGSLISRVSANRYRGRGQLAHDDMEVEYQRIRAAHFLRVHMMRVCTTFERALCALSAAEDGGDRDKLWTLAERCAHELLADRPDYAAPMGHHVLGCLFAQKGLTELAISALDRAISGLGRVDMGYLASCAKARRGALGGGELGRELLQASRARLIEQGIVNVERCLDMSAPGFRGARR